jgi:hypothetical protein
MAAVVCGSWSKARLSQAASMVVCKEFIGKIFGKYKGNFLNYGLAMQGKNRVLVAWVAVEIKVILLKKKRCRAYSP